MNFDLDEQQTQLKDSVDRLLADCCGFEARRKSAQTPSGWSAQTWARLAEQGLLAAPFDEADGGLGLGPVETLVIAEAFGARLVAEPYLATVVMAGTALRFSDNTALRAQLAPRIAAGELILAFADDEPGAPSGADAPATRATRDGAGWRLDGAKLNVVHGDSAAMLIVTAETSDGPGLFLIDAATPGVSPRGYRTFDGLRAAEIGLAGVAVEARQVLALGPAAQSLIERVRQHAVAFQAAEAVGIMQAQLDLCVEHLKTRKQFGRALHEFQALQHKAVEMLVALEQARSMAILAAMSVDEPDAVERRKALAAVKIVIGRSGRFVGQTAVQLHGGLGVTEESAVGWGLRRLVMIDMSLGGAERWTEALAAMGGFTPASDAPR